MTIVNSPIKAADTPYEKLLENESGRYKRTSQLLKQRLEEYIAENKVEAISVYQEYIESLMSVHRKRIEATDWKAVAREPQPRLPVRESLNQFEAEYNYQTYEPSLMDFVFLQKNVKLRELYDQVEIAVQADDLMYNAVLKQFKVHTTAWKKIQSISKGVIGGDVSAYQQAIDLFNPFLSVMQFGQKVEFEVSAEDIQINIHLDPTDMIPDYVPFETKDRTLSVKKMDVSQFNRYIHSYTCGCVLRVGREVMALLPLENALVNVYMNLLNRETGRMENNAVLSVRMDRDKLRKLPLTANSYEELLYNFPSEILFSIANGFSAIQVLSNKSSKDAILVNDIIK